MREQYSQSVCPRARVSGKRGRGWRKTGAVGNSGPMRCNFIKTNGGTSWEWVLSGINSYKLPHIFEVVWCPQTLCARFPFVICGAKVRRMENIRQKGDHSNGAKILCQKTHSHPFGVLDGGFSHSFSASLNTDNKQKCYESWWNKKNTTSAICTPLNTYRFSFVLLARAKFITETISIWEEFRCVVSRRRIDSI